MAKTVSNAYKLYKLLEKRLGKNRLTSVSPSLFEEDVILGTLDHKTVHIIFNPNESIEFNTTPSTKEVLDELCPILKEVMDGSDPICSYDVADKDGLYSIPTIEWNIKDPDERLRDIINGRTVIGNQEIRNLNLYGQREVEDYIEKEEDKTKLLAMVSNES